MSGFKIVPDTGSQRRRDRPLVDDEWAWVLRFVDESVPKLRTKWRQMREAGMVTLPESLMAVLG